MWPFTASPGAGPSSAAPEPEPVHETTAAGPQAAHRVPDVGLWERTLADEEKYQRLQYPTTADIPSCLSLMDEFLMCYALGPQLRNLYRHGTYRDCTWKWEDFKYCLSLKAEDEGDRRTLWVKRRAEFWARKRVSGSSEDVWKARESPPDNFPPLYADEVPADTPM